jgi:hypothetical protein
MFFVLLPSPTYTDPVVPESSVAEPVDPEVKERFAPVPVVILPAPLNPREVALVEIVSSEETPVSAPPVETFNPPLLITWNVPLELPMVVFPLLEAKVVVPVDDNVVNAPVEALVAPIAVLLIPVLVVLKYSEVMVNGFDPVLIEEALRFERAKVPLVAVRFNAPDERVNPLEAVSN